MKNLLLLLIAVTTLSSCTKNIIKDVNVKVTENGGYLGQPAFAIHADYIPDTWGENIEDFAVEITVIAAPITDVSSEAVENIIQPTFTKVVILTNGDFKVCQGKMVHGLGYHFDSQETSNGLYVLSYTKRML